MECRPPPCPVPGGFNPDTCECIPGQLPRSAAQTPVQTIPKALCDGSHEMRLFSSFGGGGLGSIKLQFVAQYGTTFFAVDGGCRYFTGDNPAHAVVSGVLSPEEASRLSADVAWNDLPRWGEYRQGQTCADGPWAILGTRDHTFTCGGSPNIGCGCGPDAPRGLQAAQINAGNWIRVLAKAGVPLSGPLDAVAIVDDRPDTLAIAPAWPLTRSMASIPNLLPLRSSGVLPREPYARLDDPADIAALRALRDSQPQAARSGDFHLAVREAGVTYRLFVRDALPADAAQAIEDLSASWPQP